MWAPRSPSHSPRLPCVLAYREGPRPARSKLDELLGRDTATKLLACPGSGEHREFKLDKKYQRPQGKEACGAGEGVGGSQSRFLSQPIINKFYIITHT